MAKDTAELILIDKTLKSLCLSDFKNKKELAKLKEYTIHTNVASKIVNEEDDDYISVDICTIISPPVNKKFKAEFLISCENLNDELSDDDAAQITQMVMNDYNFLFMTVAKEVIGEYLPAVGMMNNSTD